MKILIADDSRVPRLLLEKTLGDWGYEVVVVGDGEEAWQALQAEVAPKVAILDWVMPKMEGPAVCQRVRQRTGAPYVYILLLTSKDRKEDVVAGLEAGADDFLTKPFDPYELRARLRTASRILELESALLQAQETLRTQATHDPLTGVWNRSAILDFLARELQRARRDDGYVGLMMADLDQFKKVNDTYGHMTGDAVLRESVHRMQAAVRMYDAIGRFGGEEFLIVVPGCEPQTARAAGERIRESMSSAPFTTSQGPIRITISLGVVARRAGTQPSADALLSAADAALYRAKNLGRNRVELASEDDFAAESVSRTTADGRVL